ncbi:MAG: hypothetical protein J6W64_04225, partial [Bacilli bacterium]|nr:hypothetical protein [Bacilli bacterium]
ELPGDNGVADIDDGNNDTVYEYYLTVKITNVTDNLYIKVTNPIDNSVKVLSSGDANNGVISFPWYDLDNVNNLSIKVYTSTKTSCPNQEVLTTSKTLPMYNYYSTTPYCEKHPNEKICKKYVESEVTSDQFYKVVDKNNKDAVDKANDTGVISNVTNFVSKNKKGFIIGGSIIIVMGVVTTAVVIIKRRRSRLI